MPNAIAWNDNYYSSKTRIVLTEKELKIPGLKMFGKHTMTNAVAPLPEHYHKNCYEFTFVTNGAISFTVNDVNYELSGNDVFMTFPDEIHSTNLLPLSVGEIIWLQFDMSDTQQFLYLNEEAIQDFIYNLKNLNSHLIKTGSAKLLSFIQKAFELSQNESDRYRCANYITLTFYELMSLSNKISAPTTPDIEQVLAFIKTNLNSEISLDNLARICCLSTSQFKQKFKAQMGISPRHYINYKKIQLSKKMLLEGISITNIAMSLGFNTSSYFTVVFKRYNACSPSEYLKHKEHSLPDYFEMNSARPDTSQ